MAYDQLNVFAKILRGDIPSQKIYEDEYAFAFYDLHPKAKIHALVIPKGVFENGYVFHQCASDQEIIGFYKAVNKVVDLLKLAENGFKLVSNTGVDGGQEVPHYHIHILGGQRVA